MNRRTQAAKTADPAGAHPIGVVEQRTGLPQDVIRVWERRYRAVEPSRGAGGQRMYTDADIERLSLLGAAVRAGRRIGSIATLPTADLAHLVRDDRAAIDARHAADAGRRIATGSSSAALDAQPIIDEALGHVRALDPERLDATLRRAAARIGLAAFMEHVAAPVMRRIGDEWHAGRLTVAQEHAASTVVHDMIAGTMQSLRTIGVKDADDGARPRLLVATPAGERHVIGAALFGVAAALAGWDLLYLGADLPAEEIANAAITGGVELVALSIVFVENPARLIAELRLLRSRLPKATPILAGGSGATLLRAELAAMGIEVQMSLALEGPGATPARA